jgi:hypothetical protein
VTSRVVLLLQGLPDPVDAAGLPGVVVGQQLLVPAKTKRGRAAAVGCQQLSVIFSAAGMLQVCCVSGSCCFMRADKQTIGFQSQYSRSMSATVPYGTASAVCSCCCGGVSVEGSPLEA